MSLKDKVIFISGHFANFELMSMEITKKNISRLNICWIGDSNNVLNSLIEASIKFSFKLNIGCPKNYSPPNEMLRMIRQKSSKIKIFNNPKVAIKNADVVLTDKEIFET